MKLYGFPPSPNTRKVLATATALGLRLDFAMVDLAAGDQRKPEYLALNPSGRTPTLVDGDFVLWESNAIMQYLAETRPGPLWPKDAKVRAEISRWQCWQLAHWDEGTGTLIRERFIKKVLSLGEPDRAEIERGEKAFHRDAGILEACLATRRFLAGDAPTLADFAVAAPLELTEAAAFPFEEYPNVKGWYARIDALPAWQESRPRQ
jgi:glutathione S-transferase